MWLTDAVYTSEDDCSEDINPMPGTWANIMEFRHLPHRFQKDKTVIKEWNKRSQKVSWYIPFVLRSDYDFMLEMVKDNKYTMYFIAKELKKNRDFLLEAQRIKKGDHSILCFADESLQVDRDFLLEMVKIHPPSAFSLVKTVQNDTEFLMRLVRETPEVIDFLPRSFVFDVRYGIKLILENNSILNLISDKKLHARMCNKIRFLLLYRRTNSDHICIDPYVLMHIFSFLNE